MKSPFKLQLVVVLSICAFVTLVYLNHFNNSFQYDDFHTIVNNENIKSIERVPSFFKNGTTFSSLPISQSYRPLVSTSLAIDYWLAKGLNVFYFHLDSFLTYLLLGVLLFFFYKKIFHLHFKKIYLVLTVGTTLFYLIHPVNAETVNYIISRSEIQSTLFVILSFILYQYSSFCKKYYLFLLPSFISILAKEPGIMFVPLFLCYVWLFEYQLSIVDGFKKENSKQLLRFVKQNAIPMVFCVLTFVFVQAMIPKNFAAGGTGNGTVYNYLISQPYAISYYLGSLLLPIGLNIETDIEAFDSLWNAKAILGFLIVFALLFTMFWTASKNKLRPITFGIAWFFLALLPTSSVIPLVDLRNDHRMFFPYIGLVLALGYSIGLIIKEKKLIPQHRTTLTLGSVLLLAVYSYGTTQRNKVWKTQYSLWLDVVNKSPNNGKAWVNCGLHAMNQKKYSEAETYFEKALKITPNYSLLYVNYGRLKQQQQKPKEAEIYLKKAIDLLPTYHASWHFYGLFLKAQNQLAQAIIALEKAVSLSNYIEGKYELMKLYEQSEKWESLKVLTQQVLTLNPNNAIAHTYLSYATAKKSKFTSEAESAYQNPTANNMLDLSVQYYQKKDYPEAIKAAQKLVAIDSNSFRGYNNICACYIKLNQLQLAKQHCEKAVALKPNFKIALNNLKNIAKATKKTLSIDIQEKLVAVDSTEYNYLNLSYAYFVKKRYQDCIKFSKKGIEKFPKSYGLYNNLCSSYTELNKFELAKKACEKGLKIKPQNIVLQNNLVSILKQLP